MQRTKGKEKEKSAPTVTGIKWINKGGTFRMANGKIIKRNQVFLATPDEVPVPFRDVVKAVDPIPEPELVPAVSGYKLSEVSEGWFNIVDVNGKPLNENPLNEEDARTLLDQLR